MPATVFIDAFVFSLLFFSSVTVSQLVVLLNRMMGIMVSKTEGANKNKLIEEAIREDMKRDESIFKLLLLGAAESGKSTIVKQMRILHTSGFKEEELKQHKEVVLHNIIENMAAIIRAMERLMISFEDSAREADAAIVLKAEQEWLTRRELSQDEWQHMKLLWADGGVQACFKRANEYQIGESTKFFCENMGRISSHSYTPTQEDILLARISTLGIVEISFPFRGLTLRVIDVGGQRSQRKKWIHCFDRVNCLIFVAALSEYNQVLMEDSNVNRMHESLRLFDTVCNCQWFVNTPTILFLNKKDIFDEKLDAFPLTLAFPHYTGPQVYTEAVVFVEEEFRKRKNKGDKELYIHRTCATDTTNIEFVMAASFDVILTQNVNSIGWS